MTLICRSCGKAWRWDDDRAEVFRAWGFPPPETCPRCRERRADGG